MSNVQIYILSRDRLEFCRQAIQSALSQTYRDLEVIVSENSDNQEIANTLANDFKTIKVKRRNPTLPALTHFNCLIAEATAKFVVLFHDDDALESTYVERMISLFEQHPNLVAIGCNARIIRGNTKTKLPFMGAFSGSLHINEPLRLLKPYLSLDLTSPAPFPGYMYRTSAIKGLTLDKKNGGKHSDVAFLSTVLRKGSILWTSECLFNYRFHDGNDSNAESVPDRLRWLRYIYSEYAIHPKCRDVTEYKFIYWTKWLQQNNRRNASSTQSKKRRKVVFFFVMRYALRIAVTRAVFWKRIWRVLKEKLGIIILRSTS